MINICSLISIISKWEYWHKFPLATFKFFIFKGPVTGDNERSTIYDWQFSKLMTFDSVTGNGFLELQKSLPRSTSQSNGELKALIWKPSLFELELFHWIGSTPVHWKMNHISTCSLQLYLARHLQVRTYFKLLFLYHIISYDSYGIVSSI